MQSFNKTDIILSLTSVEVMDVTFIRTKALNGAEDIDASGVLFNNTAGIEIINQPFGRGGHFIVL